MSKLIVAFIPIFFAALALALLTDFSYERVLEQIRVIEPFDWHAVGVALFCGTLIGWERMLRNKVLGIRTSIFIILGVYILTVISASVATTGYTEVGAVADPTRGISAIITGIGFLGAGVMFTKGDTVKGLTSAATIWMLAAIGVVIGVGYLASAIILTTVGVVLLIVINELDSYLIEFSKRVENAFTFYRTMTVPVYNQYRVKTVSSSVPGYLGDQYRVQIKGKYLWKNFDDKLYDDRVDCVNAIEELEKQDRAAVDALMNAFVESADNKVN